MMKSYIHLLMQSPTQWFAHLAVSFISAVSAVSAVFLRRRMTLYFALSAVVH